MNETPLLPHPLTFSILALADPQGRLLHLLPLICPWASASGGKLMTPVLPDSGSCHAAPVADGALCLEFPCCFLLGFIQSLWFLLQEACSCLLLPTTPQSWDSSQISLFSCIFPVDLTLPCSFCQPRAFSRP